MWPEQERKQWENDRGGLAGGSGGANGLTRPSCQTHTHTDHRRGGAQVPLISGYRLPAPSGLPSGRLCYIQPQKPDFFPPLHTSSLSPLPLTLFFSPTHLLNFLLPAAQPQAIILLLVEEDFEPPTPLLLPLIPPHTLHSSLATTNMVPKPLVFFFSPNRYQLCSHQFSFSLHAEDCSWRRRKQKSRSRGKAAGSRFDKRV